MPVDVKFPAPEPTNVFCVPKLWANAVPPRVITPDVGLVVMGRLRLPATSSLAAGVVVPIPTLPVFITVSTFDPVNADPLITSNRLPPTRRLFPKLENTVPSDDMLCTHTLPRPDVFCQVSGAPPDRARCKGPTGLVVPMPIFPLSKMEELPSVPALSTHFASRFVVPVPVVWAVLALLLGLPGSVADCPLEALGAAPGPAAVSFSIKEDSGMPCSVSASAAFKAYGTLTKSTRPCSCSLGRLTCTPNQRGSPVVNSS